MYLVTPAEIGENFTISEGASEVWNAWPNVSGDTGGDR